MPISQSIAVATITIATMFLIAMDSPILARWLVLIGAVAMLAIHHAQRYYAERPTRYALFGFYSYAAVLLATTTASFDPSTALKLAAVYPLLFLAVSALLYLARGLCALVPRLTAALGDRLILIGAALAIVGYRAAYFLTGEIPNAGGGLVVFGTDVHHATIGLSMLAAVYLWPADGPRTEDRLFIGLGLGTFLDQVTFLLYLAPQGEDYGSPFSFVAPVLLLIYLALHRR